MQTIAALRPPRRQATCKVCAGAATLLGMVDFNKNCEERRGTFLELSGIAVYYHRCETCHFIFTEAFDDWSFDEFRNSIYNSAYLQVDPRADGSRARAQVESLTGLIRQLGVRRVLDYGGGNGELARELSRQGFDAVSWDPVTDRQPPPATASFDLVTAFEVFEHTPTPASTIAQAMSFLRPGQPLLFSTLLAEDARGITCDWWYLAPRNGHISFYTQASLARLFKPFGYTVDHFNNVQHIAHRGNLRVG